MSIEPRFINKKVGSLTAAVQVYDTSDTIFMKNKMTPQNFKSDFDLQKFYNQHRRTLGYGNPPDLKENQVQVPPGSMKKCQENIKAYNNNLYPVLARSK